MTALARAVAAVDPRMRARRAAVARSAGRRRLHRLVAAAVVLSLAAVSLAVLHSGVLEARHRLLRGATDTPASAVWRAAGISSATPLVDVSSGAAARRVEQLPWVGRASVQRHWPDTVVVTVTEREPVAVVGQGASAVVVDRTGRVLAPAAGVAGAGALPRLTAPGVGPRPPGRWVGPQAAPALAVAADEPSVLAGRVTQVTVGAGDTVTLALTGGIQVAFGPATEVIQKFESLAAVLADPTSAPTGPAVIDVTDPQSPVVGPPTGG